MRICVLQPDYSTSDVDYQHYDPARELSHLMPEAVFDHVLLNKLTTYKQLRTLAKNKYDIFINLCRIDLDMNNFVLFRIGFDATCNAIVKAHTYCD